MAKVVIYPQNPVQGLSTLITSLGHTPVYKSIETFTTLDVTVEGPPGENGVIMVLFTVANSDNNKIINIQALNNLGYFISVGRTNSTASTSVSLLYNLGLSNSSDGLSVPGSLLLKTDSDFFSQETKINPALPLSSYSSFNNGISLYNPIILLTESSNRNHLFYFKEGTVTFKNFTLKVPLFYIGFLWDFPTSETTQNVAKYIFKDIFNYAIDYHNPKYKISGTIKDLNENPLIRQVAVYSVEDKTLLGTTFSNDSGEYELLLKKPNPVFIMYIPNLLEKPDVHYNITPILAV